jgi:hypothetical protein
MKERVGNDGNCLGHKKTAPAGLPKAYKPSTSGIPDWPQVTPNPADSERGRRVTTEQYALGVSFVSVSVAFLALGWNVYRDVLLRARTKVTAYVSYVVSGEITTGPFITVRLTNLGPGRVVLTNLVVRRVGLWARLSKAQANATINYDHTNHFNVAFPLTVGEQDYTSQLLNFERECFLKFNWNRFGFMDSLNRYHYVRKKDLRELKRKYREDFSDQALGEETP